MPNLYIDYLHIRVQCRKLLTIFAHVKTQMKTYNKTTGKKEEGESDSCTSLVKSSEVF